MPNSTAKIARMIGGSYHERLYQDDAFETGCSGRRFSSFWLDDLLPVFVVKFRSIANRAVLLR
jgi:hypothetical protein